MKNKRTLDIIHILLEHDSFMTVAQIAKKLNVSNKTIRNDLIEVEEVLKKDQIQLIKKTGMSSRSELAVSAVRSGLTVPGIQ